MSDHQYIELSLENRCRAADKGRGGKGRSPSWNIGRLSRERLREHLEETRLIYELGWVCPAGSLVGPLVWNVMYDDFLRSFCIIDFADDALAVCAAEDVRILELRINVSLWRAKRWMNTRGLKMAGQEILLVPEDRSLRT